MATDLRTGTTNAAIWKTALPIALALLVPQLNLIINSIFLGHHSETSLALASITGVYYLVFVGVGYGLNNGLQTLLSRRAGENNHQEIGVLFSQGILIALCFSILGILITYTVTPALFRNFLGEENAGMANSFLFIRIWGLPFLYIYQLRNALLVSIHKSKFLVVGTLAEALANVLFDYLLIYGNWGFPAMGFNGAAVASVIAEFVGMFVIYLLIYARGITKEYALFQSFRFNKQRVLSIASISGPLIFQHGASVLSWLVFYMLIERNASATGLAISTVMRTVFGFFGSFFWAFAATSNAMVSNVMGQNRKEEVLPLIWKITRLSFTCGIIVCSLLNAFPEMYLSLFAPGNALIAEGVPVLRVVAFAMLLVSVGTVWLNAVTGTGNSRATFGIEVVALVFYCAYIFLVLETNRLPILWGWLSEVLYWLVLFVMAFLYLRSGRWKKKVI